MMGGCGSLLCFQPSQVESGESPEQDGKLDKASGSMSSGINEGHVSMDK